MSYGYDGYSQIEYAQPHPNLTAVQLGFTLEEMAPILKEQQEWMATMSYMVEQ
jgi:hypothetical protein